MNQPLESQQPWESRIGRRPVYIWGARAIGCGMLRTAERLGLNFAGFLDSDPALHGKLVLGQLVQDSALLPSLLNSANRPYIVTAASASEPALRELCLDHGLIPDQDFCSTYSFCDYEYVIDIVGSCNLRCPSCARGNFGTQPPPGLMSPEKFKEIVAKILRESPGVNVISLYNWGEPLLHPKLPEIISTLREHKIFSSFSSNLNIERDLKPILMAKPDMLKVSLSGFYQETYSKGHARGDIRLVKSNLYRLRYLMDKYHPDLNVEVIFHKYKYNLERDYHKVKELCEELNFIFASCFAYMMPVEKVIAYSQGEMSEQDRVIADALLVEINGALKEARQRKKTGCSLLEKQVLVNWDGSVSLCCASFDPAITVVEKDFLQVPVADIRRSKNKNPLCGSCMKTGVHQYYFETSQNGPRDPLTLI